MKIALLAAAFALFAQAADACTNMRRLQAFDYSKHATGLADFAGLGERSRDIVVRHQTGISKVAIRAKRGASGIYTRAGSGEPLPISVGVTPNLCREGRTQLFNRKVHAKLRPTLPIRFLQPVGHPQNRKAVVSFAQTVLRATYCPSGEIRLNSNYKYVDKSGANPVIKTVPTIRTATGAYGEQWNIQFTCSAWRKAR